MAAIAGLNEAGRGSDAVALESLLDSRSDLLSYLSGDLILDVGDGLRRCGLLWHLRVVRARSRH